MPAEKPQSGHVVGFNDVFAKEIEVINKRREKQNRGQASLLRQKRGPGGLPTQKSNTAGSSEDATDSSGEPVLVPDQKSDLIGLALSGGGIRSAAFCLGALQALDEAKVLDRVDYLSTVSGGGYIGCSLSACLDAKDGEFPFKINRFEDETPATQHIRDYSNYLLPNGGLDALHNLAIYIRGLIANAILIMPFLLFAAVITIFVKPTVDSLQTPFFIIEEHVRNSFPFVQYVNIFPFNHFVVTAYLSLVLLAIVIVWSMYRSTIQGKSEVPSGWTTFVGAAAFVVLFSAFCELQPFVLAVIANHEAGVPVTALTRLINKIAVVLAPLAAIIAFFARQLAEVVKTAAESPRMRVQIAAYLAKAAIYLAAVIVPLLLWAIYLQLANVGICPGSDATCPAPKRLANIAHALGTTLPDRHVLVLTVYGSAAAICILLMLILRPNANSLHPLYRDRLAKAFLFEPQETLEKYCELKPLRKRLLSELSGQYGPYHIVNTALNIQNSKTANRRGRNADFFSFSRDFIGSEATGYVATADVESVTKGLDFASVMAISGAAASSNMGAQSIKPLTPTLAILNIRLGYWLRNPRQLGKFKGWNRWVNLYFLAELFGRLNEHWKSVYLTDGGHIENLGIYELLKRHCRLIIAIDAEADFELAFGSFNTLVRYARIDLGIEIDLPWEQIRDVSREIGEEMDKTGNSRKLEGPHCAIGQITYADQTKGILVYIKSSLTGDENDYVFHYRKRHPRFPHESTLEQMFSEEQFEAYRALGYHAANGLFDRRDTFAQLDLSEYPDYGNQVAFVDQLFPRVLAGGPLRQHPHLTDWLPLPQAAQACPSGAML